MADLKTEIPIEELQARIAAAMAYKAATCGEGYIDEHFERGLPKPKRVPKTTKSADEIRRGKNEWNKLNTRKRAAREKENRGGISGVSVRLWTQKRRWYAHVGHGCSAHECAIEAAEKRNRVMARLHPGDDAFQCDLAAVWAKWGCACGRHTRGTK
jgi:hypothetical protein